jgi:2-aminoadipate transaminase
MNYLFANRARHSQESFLREVLKVTKNPEVISFAGGLPNPQIFPVQALAEAAVRVFQQDGRAALQYSTTEGYLPLREYITQRYYRRYELKVDPEDILMINGSQQGLDLIGKVFLDRGDQVVFERPGYFGAIHAFSFYEPQFLDVPLHDDGIAVDLLEETFRAHKPKLFYTVPNFHNPSAITYSAQKRRQVAALLEQYGVVGVEDDPYGELRYTGQELPAIKCHFEEGVILLGTFSKIVSPGMRLGWICAPQEIMKKLIIAKQAADLHSNYLSQRIIYQYLHDNDLDEHVTKIRERYKKQRDLMLSMIAACFPEEVSYIVPEGGMFLWLTLPEGYSAMDLFPYAARENVAFVPGEAFFLGGRGKNTLRLSFSNTDEGQIEDGMERLARAIKTWLAAKGKGQKEDAYLSVHAG